MTPAASVIYAHKFNTLWRNDIDVPEQWGFASGQVTPLNINTTDHENLYAWHIQPLAKYSVGPHRPKNPENSEWVFRYDKEDPKCRLIISFHGNAGSVAQGWRTEAYKTMATADPYGCTHILAFDYRGFGKSTGDPSEAWLIMDGLAVVQYALLTLKFPLHRILLVGHSLGAAVASGVAEWYTTKTGSFDFAGLLLISAFSDVPTLAKTYRLGGVVPLLSPLQSFPVAQDALSSLIQEKWNTTRRLSVLVRAATNIKVHIIHSMEDSLVPWEHSTTLFNAVIAGLRSRDVPVPDDIPEFRFGLDRIQVITRKGTNIMAQPPPAAARASDYLVKRTLLRYGGRNGGPLTH